MLMKKDLLEARLIKIGFMIIRKRNEIKLNHSSNPLIKPLSKILSNNSHNLTLIITLNFDLRINTEVKQILTT